MAGLVAVSAGCAVVRPAAAVIIGLVAGALMVYSVEWLELHLGVDDPGGSVSVHAVAGLWGLLAAGCWRRWLPAMLRVVAGATGWHRHAAGIYSAADLWVELGS